MCTPAIPAARKVLDRSEKHKAKVGDAWRDGIALKPKKKKKSTLVPRAHIMAHNHI